MRKRIVLFMVTGIMMAAMVACSGNNEAIDKNLASNDLSSNEVSDLNENETMTYAEKEDELTNQLIGNENSDQANEDEEQSNIETSEEQITMDINSNEYNEKETTNQSNENKNQGTNITITNKVNQSNNTTTSNKDNQSNNTSVNKEQQNITNEEQEYNKDTKEKQTLARNKIKKLMPSIVTSSMTELQKVIAIHDWIVINMDYAYSDYVNGTISKEAHTAYGGLETGYVVCNGYVELFSMMAEEVGIETKKISGYANYGLGDEMHSWSQVKINGNWYNVDLTWDDPTWKNKEHDDNLHVSYRYFLLSDDEFYKEHRPYKDGEYYTETPSVCKKSISVPEIIDASVTKRAVYFTNVKDMERFNKDIEKIASTDIKYFAVYCMNGDAIENKRTINSVVAKTLKPYNDEGSELPYEGYQILFYERRDDMLVATNEAECIEMIKKAIRAKENGKEYMMRCVNEIFADDKANYNGDMYYNKESAICEAKVYRWTAKAGIQEVISCISGDGYTCINIGDFKDGRKLIVADSPENALIKIKNYIDTLDDESKADIRVICIGDSLVPDHRNEISLLRYLGENGYLMGYDLSVMSEYDLGQSVYMCIGVKVNPRPRIYDFASLKAYIEKCEAEYKHIGVYYYDSNITKDNYEKYMHEVYKKIGRGTIIYKTYYVKEGVVFIQ